VQISHLASSDATTTSVNPYAIPNCKNSAANKSNSIAGDSQDEVFYFRSVSEPGTAFEYCACGQPVCGDQTAAGFLIVFGNLSFMPLVELLKCSICGRNGYHMQRAFSCVMTFEIAVGSIDNPWVFRIVSILLVVGLMGLLIYVN
jgi:hypothetical protein